MNIKSKEVKHNTHSKENNSITSNKDNAHIIEFYKNNTDRLPEQLNNLHDFFFQISWQYKPDLSSQNLFSSVDKTVQKENLNDSSQDTLWNEISI